MGGVVLTAVVDEKARWRVKIAWPDGPEKISPRYFGQFKSQAEAEQWIQSHQWLSNPAHFDSDLRGEKTPTAAPSIQAIRRPNTI
jgi:hypothetical protein